MQNNGKKFKPAEMFFNFFRGMARHPFIVFLFLFAIAAAVAGGVFVNFQNLYLSSDNQGQAAPAVAASFDHSKAEKYRKVFSIIEQREKDYQEQAATSTAQ